MASAGRHPLANGVVIEAARAGEFDRYISALLAPDPARAGLLALAAFSAELDRIAPLTQREPAIGEIRLQWWREALEADVATGNPVADAVLDAARLHAWPRDRLLGTIDGHAHDGLADPFADDRELMDALALNEGTLFALAARTLGAAPSDIADAAAAAGVAYGLARRLVALPHSIARKHVPLPQSRLAAAGVDLETLFAGTQTAGTRVLMSQMAGLARDQLQAALRGVAKLPRGQRVAFLPLALVGPYLRIAESPGRNPLRDPADLSPLRRLLRITGMHVFGRA